MEVVSSVRTPLITGGKTIADVVKEISDDSGKEVSVKSFSRFMLGESLD